jgi:hypothetical protein
MDPQKGRRSFFVFGSNNEPVRERGLIKVSEEDAVRSSRAREENAQRQRRILERAGPADTKQTNTSAGDEKIRFEAPLYKPSTASPTPPGPGGASYFPWSVVPVDGGGAQIVDASGVPTGWEATTDTPTSARIVWTGTAPTFIQSEAWLPIARVILGSHPYLPGYDFQVGEDVYHLEQLCTTRLILARGPVNGRVVYYPIPL